MPVKKPGKKPFAPWLQKHRALSKGGGKNHHCTTGYFGDGASKSYKYTISANGIDNDPTIEIKP